MLVEKVRGKGMETPICLLEGQILGKSQGQKSDPIEAVNPDRERKVFADAKSVFPLISAQPRRGLDAVVSK
jgi:hypothetical protein